MNGIGLLRCICDETRFGILERLQEGGELCVSEIVGKTGKDQPLVSHHLRTLRQCGIVRCRDEGKRALYSISNPRLAELITRIRDASREIPVLCKDGCC